MTHQHITPAQIAKLAKVTANAAAESDLNTATVAIAPHHGTDAILYQLHDRNGTFGSWVALDAHGRHEWEAGYNGGALMYR